MALMRYRVVEAEGNTVDLAIKVEAAMGKGWEPIGGVAVRSVARRRGALGTERRTTFFQAMTRPTRLR